MKLRLIYILLLSAFAIHPSLASQPSQAEIDNYRTKIKQYKRQIITKELDLSRETANKFFPLYEKMDEELEKVGHDTYLLETRTIKNANASELDCETTARALFEQKKNEGEIELRYFEKFRSILSPRQLLMLKNAERKFRRQVIQHFRDRND